MHSELAHVAVSETTSSGPFLIKVGVLASYFFLGVEWVDDHSGLFVAVGAIISTAIAIRGGLIDRKDKREKRTAEKNRFSRNRKITRRR